MAETGHISINTDNILPIIKKWLYAEKEIFLRELVSNSTDAIHKLEKLSLLGEVKTEIKDPKISIVVDKKNKQIQISDTGLGMTADEVKRYITQVAFSGLQDFVEKFKGKGDEEQIIGHFGLGFYSSFMVSDKVEIDTLSYQEGAKAIRWSCTGDTSYEITESQRTDVGTTITLHISDNDKDLLDVFKIEEIVAKYCAFLKYPIFLQEEQKNTTQPLWSRAPSELKEEDYKDFFGKVFPMQSEPLFWIHLNVDYPFKLRGILYFPRLGHEMEAAQGSVKLFCNQVYVEDNCKELIPEYLTLLKGVIDCPDLPLNVSRSALQKDVTVQKISRHITKKIADKLSGMHKTDLENYEKYWDDIHPFIKYGMMRDEDFFDKMKDSLIFKTTLGKYLTVDQYNEKNKALLENKIYYTTDQISQINYNNLLKEAGVDVIISETVIDKHFLPYLEMKLGRKAVFQRVDSDISEHLIEKNTASDIVDPSDNKTSRQKVEDLFKKHLNEQDYDLRVESLKKSTLPGFLVFSEDKRRFQEMIKLGQIPGAQFADLKEKKTLVINEQSPAIKNLLNLSKSFHKEVDIKLVVDQIVDLASIQQNKMDPEAMARFIDRSSALLAKIGKSDVATSS